MREQALASPAPGAFPPSWLPVLIVQPRGLRSAVENHDLTELRGAGCGMQGLRYMPPLSTLRCTETPRSSCVALVASCTQLTRRQSRRSIASVRFERAIAMLLRRSNIRISAIPRH